MDSLIIEAGRTERHYWRDLWRYRELFYFLAWRDILVRYKQTVVGVAWSLIRPFLTMIVFTVIFGKLAGMPSEGVPYPILVFTAMLPWQLFSNSFSESGNSLVANSNLISKIYFPRLIVPSGSVVVGCIDFLISGVFFGRSDALVSLPARLASFHTSTLHLNRPRSLVRRRFPHFCAYGRIPRFPFHRSFHCPVRPLHLPGRFQQQHRPGKMATTLLP